MDNFVLALHSILRYVILILGLWAIIRSLSGWMGKKPYTAADNKVSLFLLISAHTQFLVGLILYFYTNNVWFNMLKENSKEVMKNAEYRFWAIEHILVMLIAVILITVGRSKSKRAATDVAKFKTQAIFFIIAFVLILSRIPWDKARWDFTF